MIDTSAIRKNLKIIIDKEPWVVVDFQFVKPGKGQAFTRTRLKNLITGNVIDKSFRSGEKLEEASTEEHEMSFLYSQDNLYHFMNNETYDQVAMTEEQVGAARFFLAENMNVEVLNFNGRPIGITLPNFVELQIIDTEPAVKGDTVSGATKMAELSTGYRLSVPLFLSPNDWIVIDTRTGEYVERVKK
jgi:elongation factor P